MDSQYPFGTAVRLLRNVRNDGTFSGKEIGDMLVRRGAVGHVRDVGTFLQDQVIYTVHFLEDDMLVGCRQEELQLADEPWNPSRFEFRDKVKPLVPLGMKGEVLVEAGSVGEVVKVLGDEPGGVAYHVLFNGRVLQVPEKALEPAQKSEEESA